MLFQNESLFRKVLAQWLADNKILSQTIEMGGVDVGVPDLYFASKEPKMSGWLELKNIGRLDDVVKIPFRPGQLLWMSRFLRSGVYCALVLAHDLGVSVFSGHELRSLYSKASVLSHCCRPNASAFVELLKGDYFHEQEDSYWISHSNVLGDFRDVCGDGIYRDYSTDDLDPN